MKKSVIIATMASLLCASPLPLAAKRTLMPRTDNVEFLDIDTATVATATDSLTAVEQLLPPFDETAVTLRGFNKRVSDNNETFFVQNNTGMHISGITVTLRYIEVGGGQLLHERTVHVPCNLPAAATRQVTIDSFDRQHLFYYYLSGKPRKSATPFTVSVRLMGYDIAIKRQ